MVSVATDDRRPLALQWPCTRMMLMTVAGFTSFFVTLPSLPAYVASAGNSTASAGATTTVMLAATVLFQPVVPALLRRLSTPATVAIGLLVLGLPAPLLIWASSGAGLYLICVVRGVGFAIFTVAGAFMASEVAPPGRQGETAGLYGLAARDSQRDRASPGRTAAARIGLLADCGHRRPTRCRRGAGLGRWLAAGRPRADSGGADGRHPAGDRPLPAARRRALRDHGRRRRGGDDLAHRALGARGNRWSSGVRGRLRPGSVAGRERRSTGRGERGSWPGPAQ